jgi:hypothetical protein
MPSSGKSLKCQKCESMSPTEVVTTQLQTFVRLLSSRDTGLVCIWT